MCLSRRWDPRVRTPHSPPHLVGNAPMHRGWVGAPSPHRCMRRTRRSRPRTTGCTSCCGGAPALPRQRRTVCLGVGAGLLFGSRDPIIGCDVPRRPYPNADKPQEPQLCLHQSNQVHLCITFEYFRLHTSRKGMWANCFVTSWLARMHVRVGGTRRFRMAGVRPLQGSLAAPYYPTDLLSYLRIQTLARPGTSALPPTRSWGNASAFFLAFLQVGSTHPLSSFCGE